VAGDPSGSVDRWSDPVKAKLAEIAAALVGGGAAPAAARSALAEQVEVTDTEGHQFQPVYDCGWVKTLDWRAPGRTVPVTPAEFLRRWRDVLGLDATAGADREVKFKLFGIARDGDRLVTRQRLTAQGARGGLRVGSMAVSEATWAMGDDGEGPPRLARFTFQTIAQNELAPGSHPGFEDIAGSVLRDVPAWREQLLPGMNTWALRIERSLKPDFLGYHGLAVGDVDGDGLEDVYLCQPGGLPNLLLVQQPDGSLADQSAAAGVDWLDNSTGALLVDLDNDGDADLAVATSRGFLVMENDGAGRFALRAGHPEVALGYSPSAADFDADGDLDILVLRYGPDSRAVGDFPTPHPLHDARNGGANVLLENRGAFRFADATDASGLGAGNHRFSFAASWEDYDDDGDPDVYIANDFGPNSLYRNDGGRFSEVAAASGAEDWGFGMSATWGDYDRDGLMDLYVSNMFSGAGNQVVPQTGFSVDLPEDTRSKYLKMVRGNSLLRNLGGGRFADATDPAAEGFAGWAWGAKFADLDNDGWEDLYVANGYVSQPDKDDL
jgi:hypothetical protein